MLRIPAGVQLNGNYLTDQGRQPMDFSVVSIEYSSRMWDGTMRKRHVADKTTIRLSWENIASTDVDNADGNWGVDSIESFYDANKGPVTATITYADETTENFTVYMQDFNKQIIKRGAYDLCSLSLTLEEV